ncbi:MAG: glutamine amidotransferase [Deinococcus-Thermus bacterium]|jgi:GMP synthase (glutamine-hydrolysing)|nr:glutamine amidotransferase [Deinococcota bacterium]
MKPFLILQLRPERAAADDEFAAFLERGGLTAAETRRIRLDADPMPADLDPGAFAGIIVGGGPGCISDAPEEKSPAEARCEAACRAILPEIVDRDLPFLGCCYGMGLLADHLGTEVAKGRYAEPVSAVPVRLTAAGRDDAVCAGLPEAFDVLVGHKESAQEVPRGADLLIEGEACPVQMIRTGRNVYATQFHPEADAEVFARRIEIYKHRGYFDPSEAEALTAAVAAADVALAPRILANFVRRFRG